MSQTASTVSPGNFRHPPIDCPYCEGLGEINVGQSANGGYNDETCPCCEGAGTFVPEHPLGDRCTRCRGWGHVNWREPRCSQCHGYGRAPTSAEACEVAARTMTRREYDDARGCAYSREVEARLLGFADPVESKKLAELARRLRADIAIPADAQEQARNLRWLRIGAALELAVRATILRDQARLVARRARAA